jgi:hypothetical protein
MALEIITRFWHQVTLVFLMETLKVQFFWITLFYSTHKRDTSFVGKKTFVNCTNAVHISAPANYSLSNPRQLIY